MKIGGDEGRANLAVTLSALRRIQRTQGRFDGVIVPDELFIDVIKALKMSDYEHLQEMLERCPGADWEFEVLKNEKTVTFHDEYYLARFYFDNDGLIRRYIVTD